MIDDRLPHARGSFQTVLGVLVLSAALVVGLISPESAAATTAQTAASGATATAGLSRTTAGIVDTGVVDAGVAESGTADSGIAKTTLTGFSAGNIISDAVFTNKGTMTASQIQTFLNGKVKTCRSGYTCLKDLKVTTQTKAADKYCSKYTGASNESAATIIYKVAQACGINPQVLIVMLQKEQGLVTHTYPETTRYQKAMGFNCPDTAPCNAGTAGFFSQVYGAARQMQIYMDGVYFTWYAPGKTWSIRYHPNSSCGSSKVYVANKATSALYYYTPYQPNAASLAAGYSASSNTCASYGNRNFYNYFTDWFGSTQTVAGSVAAKLIKNGDPVYLISGTTRYHVQKADYEEFKAAFGSPTTVDASYVNAYTNGGAATLFLRNASTGDVSYLRDGERHRFTSCDQVKAWGSACEKETRLVSSDYTRIKAGAEMSWFAKTAYSTSTMLIEDGSLRPVYDANTAKRLNGGTTPYAALMASSVATTYTSGLTKFLTANYLKLSSGSEVYMHTSDGRLIHLAAWQYSAEFGLPSSSYHTGVASSAVNGYTKKGTLTLYASCGSTVYAASGGKLYPVKSSAVSGFDAPALDTQICSTLSLQKTSALDRVFVQGNGQDEVYYAQNGVYRHVTSRAAVLELTGGVWPTVLRVSAATISKLPKGESITQTDGGTLATGQFVRSDTSTRVYLPLADDKKVYLPSWTYAGELGLAQTQKVVASKTLDAFTESGTLGLFVTCDSQTYLAAQGTLYPVTADAVKGFSVPKLDTATCKMLKRDTGAAANAVYVKGAGQNEVYVAQNGVFRHVTSRDALTKLNGGVWPTIRTVNASTIAVLKKGSAIS